MRDILSDTFLGALTEIPAPLNVGLQDGMDASVLKNIVRKRRGAIEHHKRCFWEASQPILSQSEVSQNTLRKEPQLYV